ncbi:hypothetical protein K8I85_17665 [bacterium]|nr:hypothetical protein [bacterium]
MLALQLTPVVLVLLVLAAHFYRHGQFAFVALALAMIGLLAVPRRWASRTVQVGLLLGAAEWTRTLVVLARVRLEHGLPATRMVLILAAVALLTGASALLLRTRRARARFRQTP